MPFPGDELTSADRRLADADRDWEAVGRRHVTDTELSTLIERREQLRRELRAVGPVMPIGHRVRIAVLSFATSIVAVFGLRRDQSWLASPFGGILGAVLVGLVTVTFRPSIGVFLSASAIAFVLFTLLTAGVILTAPKEGLGHEVRRLREDAAVRADTVEDISPRLKEVDDKIAELESCLRAEADLRYAIAHRKRIERLAELAGINWRRLTRDNFDQFVAEVFQSHGYRVDQIEAGNRAGVEMIIEANDVRYGVLAIGSDGVVGMAEVERASRGAATERCHRAVIVSKGDFADTAQEAAQLNGVILIGGEQIPRLIRKGFAD